MEAQGLMIDADGIGEWVTTKFSALTLSSVFAFKSPTDAAVAMMMLQLLLHDTYMTDVPEEFRQKLLRAVRESRGIQALKTRLREDPLSPPPVAPTPTHSGQNDHGNQA